MNIRAGFLDEKVPIDANWLSGGVYFDFRAVIAFQRHHSTGYTLSTRDQ